MRILAIGNSFSQDALAYLHDLAAAGGREAETMNLYIGGCSLEQHAQNIRSGAQDYVCEINGQNTGRMISIRGALEQGPWDVVTLQQASYLSGEPESYVPWLQEVADFVRRLSPDSRLWIHQTWVYQPGGDDPDFWRYHNDPAYMYRCLHDAYETASRRLGAPLLPLGAVIQELQADPAFDAAAGGVSLYRDGRHLGLLYGRFAAAAVWYERLLDGRILENPFIPVWDGQTGDPVLLDRIRQTVHRVCAAWQDAPDGK